MSFGQTDDEFLSIDLKTLLNNKQTLEQYDLIASTVPVLSNYELNAGFVFQLAIIPIAYDVSIGERYDFMQPNEYSLLDHLSIDPKSLDGSEQLAFKSADHKRIKNLLAR